MDYTLMWGGRLTTVTVPEEVGDAEAQRWAYAQTYMTTGGNHRDAMIQVMMLRYPGIGYGPVILAPVSFATGAREGARGACGSGRSAPASGTNRGSQTPPHPVAGPAKRGAGSGTSARHTPSPRPATSSASRPLFRQPTGAGAQQPPRPTLSATPNTVGWMGSSSTNA